MRDLHNGIFNKTLKGKNLGVYDRQNQKNFVDALIISQNKTLEKSRKKSLHNRHVCSCSLHQPMPMLCEFSKQTDLNLGSEERADDIGDIQLTRNLYYSTMNRVSDEVSAKRGELLKIRDLLKKKVNSGDESTRFHYQDLLLRIEEALTIHN
jgi:hypothetical protein